MSLVPINPRPFLQDLTGKETIVKLKWGQEYHGFLRSLDSYMNIQLEDTQEFEKGVCTGKLGQVFIRCNNVLWVRGKNVNGNNDEHMSD